MSNRIEIAESKRSNAASQPRAHFRLKHILLAIVWIGANCAILRMFLLTDLPWIEFPLEAVMINLAAWSWLAETNRLRRFVWFLLFAFLALMLFGRLYMTVSRMRPKAEKREHRDTAILVEHGRSPGP